MSSQTSLFGAALLGVALMNSASAQEAELRQSFARRLPDFPKIDEVRKTAIPGLFEIRIGSEIVYSDASGEHLVQGSIVETKSRTNLTQQRVEELTRIDFNALPLKDAIVWKQGTGARKLVVFADPNCGYCKKFESEMLQVKDVTVYTFLYPILGGDSASRSRDIWCAKDTSKAWRSWMLQGTAAPKATQSCDSSVLERNIVLGRKHRLAATPLIVFADGTRRPGAMALIDLERRLRAVRPRG